MKGKKQQLNNTRCKLTKMKSQFDYNGSYTGTDFDSKYEKPVQDADDL